MFANQVHIIISIALIIGILFPIIMIANLVRNTSAQKYRIGIITFYILYLVVTTLLCFQGVFNVNSLPPRIMIVIAFPLFIFYIFFIFNTKAYKSFLTEVELSSLVKVHVFRLIGGFFILLLLLNQLPKSFALIAGIGDVLTAISAIFIAKILKSKHRNAKKTTFFWNTFGLIDILLTSGTAVYLTKQTIQTGSLGVDVLTQFPFCFIPAFAPATIIFLHITIYRKLAK